MNREVYFVGVCFYVYKDEDRQYLVQFRVFGCYGLKDEVFVVCGIYIVGSFVGQVYSRFGFDVLVLNLFLIVREVQFIVRILILGNDEVKVFLNKGIFMIFVKCEGIEFRFEGKLRQILEILFYIVD